MMKYLGLFAYISQKTAMDLTASNLNKFLFFKLPIAFIAGVRVKNLTENLCVVSVRHRWINQNPFNSMYFAVQAMSAELSTGALVMLAIKNTGKKYSMLVASNKASFTKKATGLITFTCKNENAISEALLTSQQSGEGVTFWLQSVGTNELGEQVSVMDFEWTVRIKK